MCKVGTMVLLVLAALSAISDYKVLVPNAKTVV